MNTLQEYWERLDEVVIDADAPLVQRLEMRRAFYAGAKALLEIELSIDDDVSDEAGAQIFDGLRDEIRLFAQQVKEGKA